MSLNLKIVLIIITIVYLWILLRAIQRKKIKVAFSTFWIVSGGLLILALIIPNFVEFLASMLGFEVPANMIFCITIFVAFYLIFNLTMKLAKVHENNIALVQEISLLKERVKKLENKIEQKK
jgi:hypothetical protein